MNVFIALKGTHFLFLFAVPTLIVNPAYMCILGTIIHTCIFTYNPTTKNVHSRKTRIYTVLKSVVRFTCRVYWVSYYTKDVLNRWPPKMPFFFFFCFYTSLPWNSNYNIHAASFSSFKKFLKLKPIKYNFNVFEEKSGISVTKAVDVDVDIITAFFYPS